MCVSVSAHIINRIYYLCVYTYVHHRQVKGALFKLDIQNGCNSIGECVLCVYCILLFVCNTLQMLAAPGSVQTLGQISPTVTVHLLAFPSYRGMQYTGQVCFILKVNVHFERLQLLFPNHILPNLWILVIHSSSYLSSTKSLNALIPNDCVIVNFAKHSGLKTYDSNIH